MARPNEGLRYLQYIMRLDKQSCLIIWNIQYSICALKPYQTLHITQIYLFKGYSQQMMLRLIVEAAVRWMKIGLPLKVLKIVIYDRNLGGVDKHPLLSYFRDLKVKWGEIMAKENEEPEVLMLQYAFALNSI